MAGLDGRRAQRTLCASLGTHQALVPRGTRFWGRDRAAARGQAMMGRARVDDVLHLPHWRYVPRLTLVSYGR